MTKNISHPQLSRAQIIDHCRVWLQQYKSYKSKDMNNLLGDYHIAIDETDILTYPISTQHWVSKDLEPELWAILDAADSVDLNYTDPAAWDNLARKLDAVVSNYDKTTK